MKGEVLKAADENEKSSGSKYARDVTDVIIDQLKRGTAPWTKPWEPGQGPGRPMNPTTGKEYRGANSMWLTVQAVCRGYIDPRWMTFRQAQNEGVSVRKGEKGTPIQYWMWSGEEPVLDASTGKPKTDEKGNVIKQRVEYERPRVFTGVVFNAEQIDGLPPLEKRLPPAEWERHKHAEEILTASGAALRHQPGDRAYYDLVADRITLPERAQFPSADKYYATALHELGHWSGHPSRLDRDMKGTFGTPDYAREELRAEIASMMLGQRLDIGHDPSSHASYVANWIEVLEKDPREIFRAAADAEKIADYVQELDRDQSKTVTAEHPTPEHPRAALTREQQTIQERINALYEKRDREGGLSFKEVEEAEKGHSRIADIKEQIWRLPRDPEPVPGREQPAALQAPTLTAAGVAAVQTTEPRAPEASSAEKETRMSKERTNLVVPYAERAEAKAAGARWDREGKVWFAPKGTDLTALTRWMPKDPEQAQTPATSPAPAAGLDRWRSQQKQALTAAGTKGEEQRTYLAVPFRDKDEARQLGAHWDKSSRAWFVPPGVDPSPFSKWQSKAPAKVQEDPVAEFGQALAKAGLKLGDQAPAMDGQWHRVPVEGDKPGDKSGAYRGYTDGHPAGFIENHKAGARESWKSEQPTPKLSDADKARLQVETAQRRAERDAARDQEHAKAAATAKTKWDQASPALPACLHPYLEKKGVPALGIRIDEQKHLLVPIIDTASGKLMSIQTINPDGRKSFEKGGRVSGGSFRIDPTPEAAKSNKTLLVAEGYATAATVARATGQPTYVAFNAANLGYVAKALRKQHPEATICIAADNDHRAKAEGRMNIGLVKAEAAAKAITGQVLAPEFSSDDKGTDWNDVERKSGSKAVRASLEAMIQAAALVGQARRELQQRQPAKTEARDQPTRSPRDVEQLTGWDGR